MKTDIFIAVLGIEKMMSHSSTHRASSIAMQIHFDKPLDNNETKKTVAEGDHHMFTQLSYQIK